MRARVLAALALLLGAGALLVPAPGRTVGPGGDAGVQELRAELGSGAATLDAVTLGEWIMERRPVRVLDVQDPGAHVRFAIPTARHATRRELVELERSDTPIVVYDEGTGDAARAWLVLRRLGHPRVYLLERGVVGWIDGVLEPVMPAGTPAERAAYDRAAAVSRYFGGIPRVGEPPATDPDAMEAVRLLSRRGCY